MIQFHRGTTPGWYYVSVFNWRPFRFLQHGGWFYINAAWFWRYAVTIPRARGWRWD